ncbi:MAG: MFS transporter [Nitrososphaerota archaeon]|nr:MFS transporter [Nitrososphaerota archaeon]
MNRSPKGVRGGLRPVLLLGLLSMLGDFVYEGGRAVAPDLFRQMGLTAAGVGFVMGAAELAGWVSRPLGGVIADRHGRYDLLVKIGYGSLIVIPCMAIAPNWGAVAAIVFAERVARGLRVPARDAMLAKVRGEMGLGSAFGLHEFLDQFGAVAGPLMIAGAAALHGDLKTSVVYTVVPYVALLVLVTRLPAVTVNRSSDPRTESSRGRVLTYTLAASLNVAGLLPVSVILYKISGVAGGAEWLVPLAYSVAMITDALAAIPLGLALDRFGVRVVGVIILASVAPVALLVDDAQSLLICAGLIGVVIGAHESIFRAVIAQMAQSGSLGSAYGLFGLGVGLGYSASGLVFGLMVDLGYSQEVMVAYAMAMQLLSLYFLRSATSVKRVAG